MIDTTVKVSVEKEEKPFYVGVNVQKVRGGKRPLWLARKDRCFYHGAGNTADNAIKDLQKQIREGEWVR